MRIEILLPWTLGEKTFLPGKQTWLSVEDYRRWRDLDYFRRVLVPALTPWGQRYWLQPLSCGAAPLYDWAFVPDPTAPVVPLAVAIGGPPTNEALQIVLQAPTAVAPCGCRAKKAARQKE